MSERGMMSKRGMSPLIATVLLIAFAVSLGAMIMNWSSDWGGNALSIDCSQVKMQASSICYVENMIRLSVKNTGTAVAGVTVRVIDENSRNEISLKNSELEQGQTLSKEIPYMRTSKTSVGLIPTILVDGEPTPCDNPVVEVGDIAQCSQ